MRKLLSICVVGSILVVGNSARASVVGLSDIDSGTTSPAGDYRWLDVADQEYAAGYRGSYNYDQATVTVDYSVSGRDTLQGTLTSSNLKPNFAYQLKMVGTPGVAGNELDAQSDHRSNRPGADPGRLGCYQQARPGPV